MIELSVSVSGAQIGEKLVNDHEALAYCLRELANLEPDQVCNALTETMGTHSVELIEMWLTEVSKELKQRE